MVSKGKTIPPFYLAKQVALRAPGKYWKLSRNKQFPLCENDEDLDVLKVPDFSEDVANRDAIGRARKVCTETQWKCLVSYAELGPLEAGRRLGITESTVRINVKRAVEKIRKLALDDTNSH